VTRALVTNDDGIDAPGLAVLADAARRHFDEVIVVAPAGEMSAVSHQLTLHKPLRWREQAPDRWAVSGTPVDCVLVALNHICQGRRPDIVLSGINRGPNLAYDVFYSGTVAAAREGHIKGIAAMALSLIGPAHFPFAEAEPAVDWLLAEVVAGRLPAASLLNVNLPAPDPQADVAWQGVPGYRGVRATRIGHRAYRDEIIVRQDPRGVPYAWIGGGAPKMDHVPGTDCHAVYAGYVSVTPLSLDTTDFTALEELRPNIDLG
jgi:5'-nucleotidase